MTKFEKFSKAIVKELENRFSDMVIRVNVVEKNNGLRLHGLTFKGKFNISPTIYIDDYYRQYTKLDKPIEIIVDEIERAYYDSCATKDVDISFFTDLEKVKSRIIFSLVNYERNKKLLERVPHVKYLDLAIVFRCLVETRECTCATILIHKSHLSYWNIGTEELYNFAMENTPKLLAYKLENMVQVINHLFDEELVNDGMINVPMFVLSNRLMLNGAGCVLYKDVLSRIADAYKSDFYILPSSIHEVILLPTDGDRSLGELSEMVKEINITQLRREEILSDHAYFYSRESGEITM